MKLFRIALLSILALLPCANAQTYSIDARDTHISVLIPQSRPLRFAPSARVQVTSVNATVDILEQIATTTLDISVTNASSRRLSAELLVPVPAGTVLRGFAFQGPSPEPTAQLLPREEARRIYDSIVSQTRDPALLEFVGFNLIRSSVFPVEAFNGQRIRLTYEHVASSDGNRVDYVLPRSESIEYIAPWSISVRIRSKRPIATVYSPSHELNVTRSNPRSVTVRTSPSAAMEPGAFRLSYQVETGGMTASVMAYPDPQVGGGYFLLMASPPAAAEDSARPAVRREVLLVLDRSGSMQGGKLDQVKEAALQVLEGLEEGESFNIIVYNEAVDLFSPEPVAKTPETLERARTYLRHLKPRGGTNIHDALLEALRQRPDDGALPIVLFLTDGLPTMGQTSEKSIREMVAAGNPHHRRLFTFGVGVDVNTPLLDKIALMTRGAASFVLPKEDVEVKVARLFNRLSGPVLANPVLRLLDANGQAAAGRVRDLTPAQLPDLFEGDQLIVLGQYIGEGPLTAVVEGNHFGRNRRFKFKLSFANASTQNAFVARLWASRKIATLTDAIRDLGAEPELAAAPLNVTAPRMRELIDEIVRLSKEFGILTEYTAFLAREGTDLSRPALVLHEAAQNFDGKAIKTRTGYASVNQDFNNSMQRLQNCVNLRNIYLDSDLKRVSIGNVQQVSNKAFYRRGDRWVESTLLDQSTRPPARIVQVGSSQFSELVRKLAQDGRQACVTLEGEILLQIDGEPVLIR